MLYALFIALGLAALAGGLLVPTQPSRNVLMAIAVALFIISAIFAIVGGTSLSVNGQGHALAQVSSLSH
jgi:uncharacterized membrane protein